MIERLRKHDGLLWIISLLLSVTTANCKLDSKEWAEWHFFNTPGCRDHTEGAFQFVKYGNCHEDTWTARGFVKYHYPNIVEVFGTDITCQNPLGNETLGIGNCTEQRAFLGPSSVKAATESLDDVVKVVFRYEKHDPEEEEETIITCTNRLNGTQTDQIYEILAMKRGFCDNGMMASCYLDSHYYQENFESSWCPNYPKNVTTWLQSSAATTVCQEVRSGFQLLGSEIYVLACESTVLAEAILSAGIPNKTNPFYNASERYSQQGLSSSSPAPRHCSVTMFNGTTIPDNFNQRFNEFMPSVSDWNEEWVLELCFKLPEDFNATDWEGEEALMGSDVYEEGYAYAFIDKYGFGFNKKGEPLPPQNPWFAQYGVPERVGRVELALFSPEEEYCVTVDSHDMINNFPCFTTILWSHLKEVITVRHWDGNITYDHVPDLIGATNSTFGNFSGSITLIRFHQSGNKYCDDLESSRLTRSPSVEVPTQSPQLEPTVPSSPTTLSPSSSSYYYYYSQYFLDDSSLACSSQQVNFSGATFVCGDCKVIVSDISKMRTCDNYCAHHRLRCKTSYLQYSCNDISESEYRCSYDWTSSFSSSSVRIQDNVLCVCSTEAVEESQGNNMVVSVTTSSVFHSLQLSTMNSTEQLQFQTEYKNALSSYIAIPPDWVSILDVRSGSTIVDTRIRMFGDIQASSFSSQARTNATNIFSAQFISTYGSPSFQNLHTTVIGSISPTSSPSTYEASKNKESAFITVLVVVFSLSFLAFAGSCYMCWWWRIKISKKVSSFGNASSVNANDSGGSGMQVSPTTLTSCSKTAW